MYEHQPALVAQPGEVGEPVPIPRVEFGQIVFAQSVPGRALAAAGEGLFVVGRSDVAVGLADHRVVVAPPVVPQTVVVVERRNAVRLHPVGNLRQVVGEPGANPAGHKSRNRRSELRGLLPGRIVPRQKGCSISRPVLSRPSITSQPFSSLNFPFPCE